MKPRPSQMTNCGAKFNAKDSEGQWMYTSVNLNHNHRLKPEDIRYLRAYRKVSKEVERRIMINDEAGIRPSKTYLAEAVKSHGFQNPPFLERDMRNLLQKKRQEKLDGPDSVALYYYFMKSMKESNNFFFAMDLECDGRIHNVKWVDSRSRAAYKDFSDSVDLDSTYLKNKYEMPFAPFIGINHHGQTILLGCALLSREDIETYRWLLRTWVDCIGGVAPKAIITDQSVTITKAIKLEMSNTRHRWYLWHIMKKQNKKFKSYKYFHEIKGAMSRCLSTTQRNESLNAFFKGYVNSKTSLKEFVLKYDLALGAKCDKERLAEHQSSNTRYQIVTKFATERFFQPVYTHYAYQKVMDEVRGYMYTTPSIHTDEEHFREFKVENTREFGDLPIEKKVEYMVKLQKDTIEGSNKFQTPILLIDGGKILIDRT
ncbi:protein FAR-RED IMPAIRED RESPONSE 1-like [Silene latifolia]|uniref:protein FAR-RED IMPAIRED RESPONSE 1-like n=1 Tax=Silene latifolia TaxID=37657 RepID=UPI003D784678